MTGSGPPGASPGPGWDSRAVHTNLGLRALPRPPSIDRPATTAYPAPTSFPARVRSGRRPRSAKEAGMRLATMYSEVGDCAATIVLDRPEVLNCANEQWTRDLETLVDDLIARPQVRLVVVRGAG